MKKIKIKVNSAYWMDGNKFVNYYGKSITKKRPFICIHKETIDKRSFYYFICGTSKNLADIKVKNFSKFFYKVEKSIINGLEKNTLFQTNLIYVIEDKHLNLFFDKYLGNLSKSDSKNISKFVADVIDQEIYIFSLYSDNFNKWMIINNGGNFVSVASKHPKKMQKNKAIIRNNIQIDKQNLTKIFIDKPFIYKEIYKNFLFVKK